MLERHLRYAIFGQELELYYQPIINLRTKKVIIVEALLRWRNPQLGMIPPCDFIPIAENNGQIIPIGHWVLEMACRQIKKWSMEAFPAFKVAVNVSYRQLQHPEFAQTVFDILSRTNVSPCLLELEITESSFSDDVTKIKNTLDRLKEIGLSIAIDDFGTGYTSLSYLRQYPFDKLKIDRSFIGDISQNLNGKQITSAIISLAHSLNMKVLAEGIENDKELQYLIEEHCDEGQGYLISHPKAVDEIEPVLFSNIETTLCRGNNVQPDEKF
ncbi:putative bifunctional diguanylate cyclase/phosphodiesterase [Paenibacillus oryzisoli]|nr:EAL domain-containing protein [Paenibacillus oryzisoli]